MTELVFFIPLGIGIAVLAIVCKWQIPKGPAMNRPILGIALLTGSVCFGLANALRHIQEGRIQLILSMLSVWMFFFGLALILPPPFVGAPANQHSIWGKLLIWIGLPLGIAHPLALLFTEKWPALLLQFYAALGLTP